MRSAMEPLGEIHVDTGRGNRSELERAFPPPPFPTDEDHEVARIREECDHVQYLFCIYLLVTSSLELYCGQTIRPQSETRDPEEALLWRLRGRPGDGFQRNFSAHLNQRDWHRRTRGEDDLRDIPNRKERALALDSADPTATVLAWGIGPRWAVQRCADRVEGIYIRQSRAYNKDLQLNTRGGDDSPLRWFTSWKCAKKELERRRHAEAEEERRRERERQGKPFSKWTQKEDDLLIELDHLGQGATRIASQLEGRTVQAVRDRLRRLKREEMGEEEWQRAKEERLRAKADEEELVRQRAKEIVQRAKADEEELVRQRAKLLLLAQAVPDASSDEGAFGGPEAEPPGTTPAWGAKKKRTKEPPAHRMCLLSAYKP